MSDLRVCNSSSRRRHSVDIGQDFSRSRHDDRSRSRSGRHSRRSRSVSSSEEEGSSEVDPSDMMAKAVREHEAEQ